MVVVQLLINNYVWVFYALNGNNITTFFFYLNCAALTSCPFILAKNSPLVHEKTVWLTGKVTKHSLFCVHMPTKHLKQN